MRGVVLALLLFCVLAPAASAQNGGVQILLNGRPSGVLTSAQLMANPDVTDDDAYMTLNSRITGQNVGYHGGTSLGRVLDLAGIPSQIVVRVNIPQQGVSRPDAQVSASELATGFGGDPKDHGTRSRKATIDARAGNQVRFFRPMRDASDFNADDEITAQGLGTNLQLDVTTSNTTDPRTLTVTVTPKNPTDADQVAFAVEVEHPGGQTFDYSWNFGDGSDVDRRRSPSHGFARGSWQVTVNAYGSDGSVGVLALPDLVVTAANGTAPTPTATPTVTATSTPNGGEGPGGAGTGGPAPTGGGAGDPHDRTSGPRKSRGKTEGKRSGSKTGPDAKTGTKTKTKTKTTPNAKAEGTATATATATPSPTPTPMPPDGARDEAAPQAEATVTPKGSLDAPDPQVTPEAAAPRGAPPGEHVEGVLLANAGSIEDVIAAARSVEAKEQERSQARAGGGGSGSPAGWIGGGGLLFVLLAAGAAREGIFRLR